MRTRFTVVLLALAVVLATFCPAWAVTEAPTTIDRTSVLAGPTVICPDKTAYTVILSYGISQELGTRIHQTYPGWRPAVQAQVSRSGSRPDIPYTPDDLDLLSRLITVEAGGEAYEVQVAVGAVVMNRVESNRFPDTLADVIFARGQFPPATNGLMDRRAATPSAVRAAGEALAGADPTSGCLYFTSARSGGGVLNRCSDRMVLGNMVFGF